MFFFVSEIVIEMKSINSSDELYVMETLKHFLTGKNDWIML